MSGLIKTILVLAHGSAPPNLHASEVNPRIDLASLPAVLPKVGEPATHLLCRRGRGPSSPSTARKGEGRGVQEGEEGEGCSHDERSGFSTSPFIGGVSSFGFGGTNAHVILEGKAGAFDGGGGVSGGEGTLAPIPGVAFLFTGQGSQYPGMGRDLYESYDEFKAVVDACDEELAEVLPRRLLSVLYGGERDAGACPSVCLSVGDFCCFFYFCSVMIYEYLEKEPLFAFVCIGFKFNPPRPPDPLFFNRWSGFTHAAKLLSTTRYAQPALFAVECATAATLRAAGVVPSAVMGHSLGELAAACAAGVMTLREV